MLSEVLISGVQYFALSTANLHTNIIKVWNSHVHREFPGKFESSNLGRGHVSREIGRIAFGQRERAPASTEAVAPSRALARSPEIGIP